MLVATFPADPGGARAARKLVRRELAALGAVAEVAELLVSELASNVVRHAGTQFTVEVAADADPVRIAVSDGLAVDLRVTAAADDATAGRGLMILDALARRWGVERHGGGKCVWFELAREQPA